MQGNYSSQFLQQPGKTVYKREIFQTLSGQLVEIVWYKKDLLDNNVLKKEELYFIDPPLADSIVPESIRDIRECRICHNLFYNLPVQRR